MVWIFALIMGLALVFFKLGNATVWVDMLILGLKLTMFVIAFLVVALLWKKLKVKQNEVESQG